MNRILFDSNEITDGFATFGGPRAEHVRKVLHGAVGQILKTGEINGPIGTGEITDIADNSDGSVTITVKVRHDQESPKPWADLILAPPRPRVLKRMLPQLAALGVGRITLVGAEKVEKDFWGATLLNEPIYRPLLVDGLMQCGTSALPTIETCKSFGRFMRTGIQSFRHTRRILAHPYADDLAKAIDGVIRQENAEDRLLLAIGPEGGWTDREVNDFESFGFRRYSLGSRILRTDTATIAILARLMPLDGQ